MHRLLLPVAPAALIVRLGDPRPLEEICADELAVEDGQGGCIRVPCGTGLGDDQRWDFG